MIGAMRSAGHWAASAATVLALLALPGVASAQGCPNEALRTGVSANLPDCRAYEQVSPAEKGGVPAVSLYYPSQAAPNGQGIAYLNLFSAFAGGQSASYPDAYISHRTAAGWQTTNVSPPTPDATPPGGDPVTYDFSEDLSRSVVNVPLQRLTTEATPSVWNLFESNEGAYTWINDENPPHVPPEGCLPELLELCFQIKDFATFAGASADFHHILFESSESLVAGAPEESASTILTPRSITNLYESTYGADGKWHVSLVGYLPDGAIPPGGSTAGSGSSIFYKSVGSEDDHVEHAISADGSSVVFEAKADEGQPDPAQNGLTEVYDRIGAARTIELSAPAPGATPANTQAQPAMFWAASADGKHVFFTSTAELSTASYTGTEPRCEPEPGEGIFACDRGDLYEYDLETKTLKDLTVDTNLPADEAEGASVQGVVGASSDGSYVYFIARGQLVPGKGVDHGYNLYMVHDDGAPVYVTTLGEKDASDWTEEAAELESYVTPSGTHVAFASAEPLPTVNFPSGYGNEGQPEVYEYTAPEEEKGLSGNVVCASCDPSGAAPIGPALLAGVPRGEPTPPGPGENSPFHQVRVVSENGARVFFTSQDPLTSAVNGNTHAKVYEYERDGEGSCETANGCIYLISSPSSPAEAVFLDADSEGENVFFTTVSQLTKSDNDELSDVYDARVDGGFASAQTPAPCRTSCREGSGETPPAGAPLTGSGGASGNLSPPSGAKAAVGETRTQKLAKALTTCRKKRNSRKRQSCEAQARRRYGQQPANVKHAKAKRSGRRHKRSGK